MRNFEWGRRKENRNGWKILRRRISRGEGRSTRNQWPHFRYAWQTDRVR